MPPAPTIVRPALAGIVLLAVVALTAVVLFYWWPGGVAIGVAVGAGAVLTVGAQMQRSNSRVPVDELLVHRLGVPAATPPLRVPQPVRPAPVRVPAIAPLHAQPDDAYFSTATDTMPARAVAAAIVPPVEVEPEVVAPVAAAPVAAAPVTAAPVTAAPVTAAPADAERVEEQPVAGMDDGEPDVIPATDFVLTDTTVRTDLEHLRDELGEDYLDFARAAHLVVATQYASAARLQRDLDLPYSRARRLLTDLEQQHFVGPATGSLPRVVLMPKDRLPEVERLLEQV